MEVWKAQPPGTTQNWFEWKSISPLLCPFSLYLHQQTPIAIGVCSKGYTQSPFFNMTKNTLPLYLTRTIHHIQSKNVVYILIVNILFSQNWEISFLNFGYVWYLLHASASLRTPWNRLLCLRSPTPHIYMKQITWIIRVNPLWCRIDKFIRSLPGITWSRSSS